MAKRRLAREEKYECIVAHADPMPAGQPLGQIEVSVTAEIAARLQVKFPLIPAPRRDPSPRGEPLPFPRPARSPVPTALADAEVCAEPSPVEILIPEALSLEKAEAIIKSFAQEWMICEVEPSEEASPEPVIPAASPESRPRKATEKPSLPASETAAPSPGATAEVPKEHSRPSERLEDISQKIFQEPATPFPEPSLLPASLLTRRSLAGLVDLLLAAGLFLLTEHWWGMGPAGGVTVLFLLFRDSLGLRREASPGKRLLGLRMEARGPGPLASRWLAGALRNLALLLAPVEFALLYVREEEADTRGLRLGDQWAHTRVVRHRPTPTRQAKWLPD
ncbi:hypothetical protein [Roseibacillus ishigakijimensis]|nr:hypothetical protein [Roseibacillus ishigakijimensis]